MGASRVAPLREGPGGGSECQGGGSAGSGDQVKLRAASRAPLRPLPSRGNLLPEKGAGGGDDGGPSLSSGPAARQPFHPPHARRRDSSLRSFIKNNNNTQPQPPRA